MKKKRIAMITDSIREGGGPAGYVYNLRKGLNLITEKLNIKVKFSGINMKYYPSHFVFFFWRFLYRGFNFIKRWLMIVFSDVCVFQGYQQSKYIKLAKRLKKLCIYQPHSPSIKADEDKMNYELQGSKIPHDIYCNLKNNEKELFDSSDIVVFPSDNAGLAYYSEWKSIINSKKVFYLKSGTIVRKSNHSLNLRSKFPGKTIIAFIGRFVTHKGFDIFCEAAKKLKTSDEIQFVCAGSGSLQNLLESSNIYNLGFISDVGSLLENVDMVIIPNRITYYDLLPIECAAYGKPLIFSNVGGNISQNKDMPDSLLFSSEDINDLCATIKKTVDIRNENKLWGSKNRLAYENLFTEKKMAERWLKAFHLAIESSNESIIYVE